MKFTPFSNQVTPRLAPQLACARSEVAGGARWLLTLGLIVTLGIGFASNAEAGNRLSQCGGSDQRPCNIWEKIPSCDAGLAQNFDNGTCGADVIGKFIEKTANDISRSVLQAGETVVKFSESQVNQAKDDVVKGVEETKKRLVEIGVVEYAKKGEKWFNEKIKDPLKQMADAWNTPIEADKEVVEALKIAIGKKDAAAIYPALEAMIGEIVKTSPIHQIAKRLKEQDAGSFLVFLSVGGGAVATANVDFGLAIDMDYLIHMGKNLAEGRSTTYEGAVASLFAAGGLKVGASVGVSGGVVFGYHIENPDGVNGPSLDISLGGNVGIGATVGVGFDMTKSPWALNTANLQFGAGAKIELAAGASFSVILGVLCGDGKFVSSKCASNLPGQTTTSLWDRKPGQSLTHVSVAADGTTWGVDEHQYVYQWNGSKFDKKVGHSLTQVSVGSSSEIWGVDRYNYVYEWTGSTFVKKVGHSLTYVSAAADQSVWGVDGNDYVYQWNGSTFVRKPGLLEQISVGSADNIWGVNKQQQVWKWNGSNWSLKQGHYLTHVSAAADDSVWGVDKNDYVYKWNGSTFVRLTGLLTQISGGSSSNFWGVNKHDEVFQNRNKDQFKVTLKGVQSSKCLAVPSASNSNYTTIIQWSCLGSAEQDLTFKPVKEENNVFTVVFGHSNKCLHSPGLNNGDALMQMTCDNSINQQFKLVSLGGGTYKYYKLAAQNSGKVLDVKHASADDGAKIQQWDFGGGFNQQWHLVTDM